MKTLLPYLAALVVCISVHAEPRYVTLTVGRIGDNYRTNEKLIVAPYETAEIVSTAGSELEITISKAGLSLNMPAVQANGVVLAGPAIVELGVEWNYTPRTAFVTLKITPGAFPADKTLIVIPGTNQTSVALECSTNLVHWMPATNGVYGSEPVAKFFRIKAGPVH